MLRPRRGRSGGDPVWRQAEVHEVVATDVHDPPRLHWNLVAPPAEGTYVLEVRSTWEPFAAPESTRLIRWLRRRKTPATGGSRQCAG